MSEMKSGVNFMMEFYPDGEWKCGDGSFIDYMNRPEAFQIENHPDDEFKDFIDYMKNDEKSDGLFDMENDLCSAEQIKNYRELEFQSQRQECCRYIGVLSFDNRFLEQHGLLTENGLDNQKLKELARSGMSEMIHKSKKLDDDNVYWYAAIHSNTDNIHIHFSILEYEKRYRKYDKLEVDAFDALKSKVVNKIMGNEKTIEITNMARQTLLPDFERECCNCHTQMAELFQKLPKNQTWQYGRQSFEPYRNEVDKVVGSIIRENPELNEKFQQYGKMLDEKTEELKSAYGIGERKLYENYKKNRMEEFYNRAGNILLEEMQKSDYPQAAEEVHQIFSSDSKKYVSRHTEEKNDEEDEVSEEHIHHIHSSGGSYVPNSHEMQRAFTRLAWETENVMRRSAREHERHVDALIRQYNYEQDRQNGRRM